MTNTERRLTRMLDDWISERFHAAPKGQTDAEILAAIQADLAAKAGEIFARRFPPLRGPI